MPEPWFATHAEEITALEVLTQNYWFKAVSLGYSIDDPASLANRVLKAGYNAEHHLAEMSADPGQRDPGEVTVQAAYEKVFADVRAEVDAASAGRLGPMDSGKDRG